MRRVAHAGVARAGVVGTLSQSDYTGVAHARAAHAGVACTQGWWGHLANQITQGLHVQGLHVQGLHMQGLRARRGGGDT